MARNARIRKVEYVGNGTRGPDTAYVVDMFDGDTMVESRTLPNKSIHYAEDVVENWENGIIPNNKTSTS